MVQSEPSPSTDLINIQFGEYSQKLRARIEYLRSASESKQRSAEK